MWPVTIVYFHLFLFSNFCLSFKLHSYFLFLNFVLNPYFKHYFYFVFQTLFLFLHFQTVFLFFNSLNLFSFSFINFQTLSEFFYIKKCKTNNSKYVRSNFCMTHLENTMCGITQSCWKLIKVCHYQS